MTKSRVSENTSIAPGVVDTIISITASTHDGVASIGTPAGGFFARLANRPSTSGIETKLNEEGKLDVVLHIEVEYGYSLTDLADSLRTAIADALLVQAGVEVSSIDIFVDGIRFEQN